jgi:hypothetical protein
MIIQRERKGLTEVEKYKETSIETNKERRDRTVELKIGEKGV